MQAQHSSQTGTVGHRQWIQWDNSLSVSPMVLTCDPLYAVLDMVLFPCGLRTIQEHSRFDWLYFLLAVFFVIVGMIHDLHLFTPIIEGVLAMEKSIQPSMF